MTPDPRPLEQRRADLAEQLAAHQAKVRPPEPEPETPVVETAAMDGLDEAVARMLATRIALSDAEAHALAFRNVIRVRMQAWSFPPRFIRELPEWGCEPQQKTFEFCHTLFKRVGAIVALVGVRGTGKTTIAAQLAIASAWEDHWAIIECRPARLTAVPYRKLNDLIARFKPLYGNMGSINTESLIAARNWFCQEVQLAVIDEVHECEEMQVKDRILTDLLDRRYAYRNDTLIISNQTREGFEGSTSDSVLSRIQEHGAIIPCEWESWRAK